MNEQKLNSFLQENRPEAPEAPAGEKTQIWMAVTNSPAQPSWFFRPAAFRFAGAVATIAVIAWFVAAPYRVKHQEAANTERYVASLVDDLMINLENDSFESDLSDWD